MDCFPPDIEQKLGFNIIRNRLVELAGTELGRRGVEHLATASDRLEVEARLERVGEWRLTLQSGDHGGLGDIPDLSDTLTEINPAGSWVSPEEALAVASALATTRQVHDYFASRHEACPTLASDARRLTPDRDLESRIGRLFNESGGLRDDASPELHRIRRQMRSTEQKVRKEASNAMAQAQKSKVASADEPTIRGGRIVIPIKAEAKRKLDGLVVDSSATGQTVFLEPQACVELNNDLRLLEGRERREIVRILQSLTDQIREVRGALEANQTLLTDFDVWRACARLAVELDCTKPEIVDGARFEIHKALNPALYLHRIRAGARADDHGVVPLTMALKSDNRVLLISGPNAGGKSVAMKTVGLLSLMLAHGLPVPAGEGTCMPLYGKIFGDIGDEQSMETDLSTFSSHLARLKRIVEESDESSLVLIDELGTATDPAAGAAIAQAVMEHLVKVGASAIVTTHFSALKAFADQAEGVANGAMMFDQDSLSPTYVFKPGLPGSSFAFEIAGRTSFPAKVLKRARELAGSQQSKLEHLLTTLEQKQYDLDEGRRKLEADLRAAEQSKREAAEQKQKLDDRKDAILLRAEREADELLREANRTIERTVREIREAQAERERTKEIRKQVSELKTTVRKRVKKRERAATRKKPAPRARSDEPLDIGDRVVLDGGDVEGEIQSFDRDGVNVTFGSMQTHVKRERLTKVGGPERQHVEVGRLQTVGDTGPGSGTVPEIHKRIDVRGYRVAEAIPVVERFIDRAVRGGLRRVEVLHGTGTGALRAAIKEHLLTLPEVSRVAEAPVDEGGAGLSIVELN